MKYRRMTRGAIIVEAGLLAIASLGYCQVRTTWLNAAFEKVMVGDTESDVVAKMGRSSQIVEGCGWYYKRPIAGCAREYVYLPSWSIVDEAWTIFFDANEAVSKKAHYVSP
jgi:hypothetical protein